MLKSSNGERQIVLCGWCKKEMLLRMGQLRFRVKNARHVLCCSPQCNAKLQSFSRDRAQVDKEYAAQEGK